MGDPKAEGSGDSSTNELIDQLRALPSARRLSPETLESVYGLGFNHYSQGQYEASLRYFGFLTVYRPTEPRFLNGLALSHQRLGNYEPAIQAYSMAAVIDPLTPQHMMGVADCQLLAGQFDAALGTLETVICYCKEAGGFDAVLRRAEELKAYISKHACA
ncbi:SycD/LcrH family type III secretion system chaperone [Noviherbaspirillum sp.]|uniref:SycD/LcrH family type III secretion system chaperone n=1 Tax=Noviherbaspirillum sp. TaxID=1926288 RepID=UPI002B4A48C8|nr:SycD/LcrH family type III secretion system chaperone [Noviherbaspirillum sp.]HJV80586.1 SycD/LcrH family type III secretion system chaperone [Noviherbaspirillum sp.]